MDRPIFRSLSAPVHLTSEKHCYVSFSRDLLDVGEVLRSHPQMRYFIFQARWVDELDSSRVYSSYVCWNGQIHESPSPSIKMGNLYSQKLGITNGMILQLLLLQHRPPSMLATLRPSSQEDSLKLEEHQIKLRDTLLNMTCMFPLDVSQPVYQDDQVTINLTYTSADNTNASPYVLLIPSSEIIIPLQAASVARSKTKSLVYTAETQFTGTQYVALMHPDCMQKFGFFQNSLILCVFPSHGDGNITNCPVPLPLRINNETIALYIASDESVRYDGVQCTVIQPACLSKYFPILPQTVKLSNTLPTLPHLIVPQQTLTCAYDFPSSINADVCITPTTTIALQQVLDVNAQLQKYLSTLYSPKNSAENKQSEEVVQNMVENPLFLMQPYKHVLASFYYYLQTIPSLPVCGSTILHIPLYTLNTTNPQKNDLHTLDTYKPQTYTSQTSLGEELVNFVKTEFTISVQVSLFHDHPDSVATRVVQDQCSFCQGRDQGMNKCTCVVTKCVQFSKKNRCLYSHSYSCHGIQKKLPKFVPGGLNVQTVQNNKICSGYQKSQSILVTHGIIAPVYARTLPQCLLVKQNTEEQDQVLFSPALLTSKNTLVTSPLQVNSSILSTQPTPHSLPRKLPVNVYENMSVDYEAYCEEYKDEKQKAMLQAFTDTSGHGSMSLPPTHLPLLTAVLHSLQKHVLVIYLDHLNLTELKTLLTRVVSQLQTDTVLVFANTDDFAGDVSKDPSFEAKLLRNTAFASFLASFVFNLSRQYQQQSSAYETGLLQTQTQLVMLKSSLPNPLQRTHQSAESLSLLSSTAENHTDIYQMLQQVQNLYPMKPVKIQCLFTHKAPLHKELAKGLAFTADMSSLSEEFRVKMLHTSFFLAMGSVIPKISNITQQNAYKDSLARKYTSAELMHFVKLPLPSMQVYMKETAKMDYTSLLNYIGICVSRVLTQPVEKRLLSREILESSVRTGGGDTRKFEHGDFSDIYGLSDAKDVLTDTILVPVRFKRLMDKLPMKPRSGVQQYGPPGCGKTLLANSIEKQFQMNVIHVKGPELLDKYIGGAEEKVRNLFARARALYPCVILLDEIDSIQPQRGSDSNGVTDRVVNSFLCELDGVEVKERVILVATTTRPDLVDAAVLRPGRIDKTVYCGVYGTDHVGQTLEDGNQVDLLESDLEKLELLQYMLTKEQKNGYKVVTDIPFLAQFIDRISNLTNADIVGLAAHTLEYIGSLGENTHLTSEMLEHGLKNTRATLQPKDWKKYTTLYQTFQASKVREPVDVTKPQRTAVK